MRSSRSFVQVDDLDEFVRESGLGLPADPERPASVSLHTFSYAVTPIVRRSSAVEPTTAFISQHNQPADQYVPNAANVANTANAQRAESGLQANSSAFCSQRLLRTALSSLRSAESSCSRLVSAISFSCW